MGRATDSIATKEVPCIMVSSDRLGCWCWPMRISRSALQFSSTFSTPKMGSGGRGSAATKPGAYLLKSQFHLQSHMWSNFLSAIIHSCAGVVVAWRRHNCLRQLRGGSSLERLPFTPRLGEHPFFFLNHFPKYFYSLAWAKRKPWFCFLLRRYWTLAWNIAVQYQNMSILRTNAMEYIPNYFKKGQVCCVTKLALLESNWGGHVLLCVDSREVYIYFLELYSVV
jgi:hypothetical protein